MQAAIITVGDELLAGDIENTNATWLAARLADRGVVVEEIVVLPDDVERIARRVDRLGGEYDAVLVTGGIGGTPDDVTIDAVADAFGRSLAVDPDVRERVERTVERIRERRRPAFDPNVDAWAALPTGSRPLENPEGMSPGCVVENAYVFPGVSAEMKAMFERVADEFEGDACSRVVSAEGSESSLVPHLERTQSEFPVGVGCYPSAGSDRKRLKISGDSVEEVEAARDRLVERLEAAGARPTDDP